MIATITVPYIATKAAADPNNKKNTIIKNCAPFTNCLREINNTQIDNAKDIDTVKPMCNLIEYSEIALKHLEVNGIATEMNHF